MNFTIPESIVVVIISAILCVLGWWLVRMISTQDAMAESMEKMSTQITRLCVQIENISNTQEQDKDTCDTRHRENKDALRVLHTDLTALARRPLPGAR